LNERKLIDWGEGFVEVEEGTIIGLEGVSGGDLSRVDLRILFIVGGEGDERQVFLSSFLGRVLNSTHSLACFLCPISRCCSFLFSVFLFVLFLFFN
jgi:hypothetical protein